MGLIERMDETIQSFKSHQNKSNYKILELYTEAYWVEILSKENFRIFCQDCYYEFKLLEVNFT